MLKKILPGFLILFCLLFTMGCLSQSVNKTPVVLPTTLPQTSTAITPVPSPHFFIDNFDNSSVTVKENESLTVKVHFHATDWKISHWSNGCWNCPTNGGNNIDTIPLKLAILNYPQATITWTAFGGGISSGEMSYHVSGLPVGNYTLQASTPDSAFTKTVNVTK